MMKTFWLENYNSMYSNPSTKELYAYNNVYYDEKNNESTLNNIIIMNKHIIKELASYIATYK